MRSKILTIYERVCLCSLFQGVSKTPLFQAFEGYALAPSPVEKKKAYATFVKCIYEDGGDYTALLSRLIFEDENVYVKGVAGKREIDPIIQKEIARELAVFSDMLVLTPLDFAEDMGLAVEEIPAYTHSKIDLAKSYAERLKSLDKYGYGIFSAHPMFRLSDDKEIQAIVSADRISTAHFIGYEAERQKIIDNTRAFVEGRPSANALLCGDAGTGKSSTVKAVANAFFGEGVRLIELRKDQLRYLPLVMAKISGNPLKFIIFIDDLSFNQNNDDFSMLKASLEGSASATADNAVIYATSNRRHIVKESFGDREGDDIHRNDTMQETLSLSERFGLTVLFSKPDKKLYLTIVKELAKRKGVKMDEKELEVQAEAFALRKGNRSARCAEQFINSLL